MRVAELKQEPRSRAFSQEERSQKLQLLLDDDAKPADAQGDSSDSSKGSGNGSNSE
jgi:hypothetical protein